RWIELVRKVAQLRHEGANGFLVHARVLGWPVVLITESPEDHAGMIAVLVDGIRQLLAHHLFPVVAADAAAAPRRFLPHQQAKLVAEIEHETVLLIVREADEVRAHRLDELHLFADQIIRQGARVASVVFVPMRATQQQTLTVQLEWAMLDELEVTDAEALGHRLNAEFR